jgi:hypothetical protein
MKPLLEFCIACILLLAGGCSAIAGIFTANIWTALLAVGSVAGVIFILSYGTKSKQ